MATDSDAATAPGGRKTRPRGDERRRLLVDVATRLFAERGYNKVGIAEVAAEAGITQAGLLYHFGSKEALLIAVLQQREAAGPLGTEVEPHGMDFFTSFLNQLSENEKQPQLVQLMALLSAESISDEHPGHDWFVERYDMLAENVTAEVASIIDPGKLPDGVDAQAIGRWIIGLADGLRIQALLRPGSVDRFTSMKGFLDILRPYLRDA